MGDTAALQTGREFVVVDDNQAHIVTRTVANISLANAFRSGRYNDYAAYPALPNSDPSSGNVMAGDILMQPSNSYVSALGLTESMAYQEAMVIWNYAGAPVFPPDSGITAESWNDMTIEQRTEFLMANFEFYGFAMESKTMEGFSKGGVPLESAQDEGLRSLNMGIITAVLPVDDNLVDGDLVVPTIMHTSNPYTSNYRYSADVAPRPIFTIKAVDDRTGIGASYAAVKFLQAGLKGENASNMAAADYMPANLDAALLSTNSSEAYTNTVRAGHHIARGFLTAAFAVAKLLENNGGGSVSDQLEALLSPEGNTAPAQFAKIIDAAVFGVIDGTEPNPAITGMGSPIETLYAGFSISRSASTPIARVLAVDRANTGVHGTPIKLLVTGK